jgi:hypothetical protein
MVSKTPPAAPLPYGRDWPDLDLWADRDGTIYDGRGPFERRPSRWARRKAAHLTAVISRWWWSQ